MTVKMQVRRYGKYVFPFFLMLVAASFGYNTLRIADEEKLAYSVIFEMTEKGEVKNSRVVHTVIKSDRRFTYEEAQEIIETGKGDFQEEVLQLDKLAKILRENRFKAGAINFDRYEVKFEIDEKGKPVSVYFKALYTFKLSS